MGQSNAKRFAAQNQRQDAGLGADQTTGLNLDQTILPRRWFAPTGRVEWPTLGMLILCYSAWGLGTTYAAALWLPLGMALVTLGAALHSSLSHEALHGHPTQSSFWNAALVFPALSLMVPYLRFKDTHLDHHSDDTLTDPYDDPESNYHDPEVWARLPRQAQLGLRLNNTLVGRLCMGPALGMAHFIGADLSLILAGNRRVLLGWALHGPAVVLVVWWMLAAADMPLWAWAITVYAAMSILKIRTFLEHRAHLEPIARTVLIEDRGPLAWIFLNNNLHSVHHQHPGAPWYHLPRMYRAGQSQYQTDNQGYVYSSYANIFRRHFFKAKDPVPHPLWPKPEAKPDANAPPKWRGAQQVGRDRA